MVKKDIISDRFLNNGRPLVELRDSAKGLLEKFWSDGRIKKEKIVKCPLCDCDDYILVAEKERCGIPFETVLCRNCGLARTLNQFTKESLGIFYSEYFRDIFGEPDELMEKRYETALEQKIPKYIKKEDTIIDLGCGGGWNLMPFHNNGYNYYGFDFDEKLINHGKSKGLNLYLGGVEEIKKMNIKADYLVLDQVLEHTKNPIEFLGELRPIMKDNAIINIMVPSLNLVPWGYWNADLLGLLTLPHNFTFDDFTLKKTAEKAGYEIVNCIGGVLVLKNKDIVHGLNLENIDRGEKVVEFLKLTEKLYSLRKKTKTDKLLYPKFYCLIKPKGCFKRLLLDCFSRKIN